MQLESQISIMEKNSLSRIIKHHNDGKNQNIHNNVLRTVTISFNIEQVNHKGTK